MNIEHLIPSDRAQNIAFVIGCVIGVPVMLYLWGVVLLA